MNITIKEINREKVLSNIKNKYLTKLKAIADEEKDFYEKERKKNLATLSWFIPLFVLVSAIVCVAFLKNSTAIRAFLIIFELSICMISIGIFTTDRPIYSRKYIGTKHKEKAEICKKIEDECELFNLISFVRQHDKYLRQTNFGDILLPFLQDLETLADYLKVLDSNILSVELGKKEYILNFTYADAEGFVRQRQISCCNAISIKEKETSLSFVLEDDCSARIILTRPYEQQGHNLIKENEAQTDI